jgi:membrane-associated phospholipid phosphatase
VAILALFAALAGPRPAAAQTIDFRHAVTFAPDASLALTTPDSPQDPQHPVATGEEQTKPTRGFVKALLYNLGDDLKHMPRRNSLYFLAAGGVLAAAVHPEDNQINRHLVGSNFADKLFIPGKYIGATETVLGAAAATYIVGRIRHYNRVQHLGMDLIESTILAEGITQGIKVAVRRERPAFPDGSRFSGYAFPSGHATVTFAAATTLQQHLGWRTGIPVYTVATYVAMSRLHDNRHFASDVVFGAFDGIIIGRSVTWHGRNFWANATPVPLPGGMGMVMTWR